MDKLYDVIILGAGPAGLAAGLYSGRYRLSTLIIEKAKDGGQIAITDEIENYPGQMVEGESGPSLIARMTAQAEKFGAERASDTITKVELEGPVKKLYGTKDTYQCKTLIIATGAFPRPIGCKREGEFMGKGVSFCATCDANFFEDFEIYVVGGNGIAAEESLYLAGYARKVTMIHKGPALTVSPMLKERLDAEPKIHVLCNEEVEDVGGDELLSEIVLKNTKTGEETVLHADEEDGFFGLFGFTGKKTTGMFDGVLDMEGGYIKTDECMRTNVPGVFAAGDVRVTPLRQVVTACADGAIAAMQCDKYISAQK